METLIILCLAFASALLSGTFGFGSGTIFVGLGSFFLPVKILIPLVSVLLLNPILRSFLYRKDISWKLAAWSATASIPAILIGYQFFDKLPEVWLSRLVGAGILAFILMSWADETHHLPEIKPSFPKFWSFMFMSGFMSGAGIGGSPIRGMLGQSLRTSKERFMALMAIQSVIIGTTKTSAMFHGSYLVIDQWRLYLAIAVIGVIANLLGRHFVRNMCPKKFRMGVLIILGVIGVRMVLG